MSESGEAKKPFWLKARAHFHEADKLLSDGGDEKSIYAALRLRMALECLAYSYLQALKLDLQPNHMRVWQAGKIVKLLKEIDPEIDVSRALSPAGGGSVENGPTLSQLLMGEDNRLPARRIHALYNKLGKLLHEDSLEDLRKGRALSEGQAEQWVRDTVNELRPVGNPP